MSANKVCGRPNPPTKGASTSGRGGGGSFYISPITLYLTTTRSCSSAADYQSVDASSELLLC